jgi:high-affinity nickel permease
MAITALELSLIAVPLGLRHGFDYDHLAAIADISSLQTNWKQGMKLGLLYALGHALTLFILAAPILLFGIHIPALRFPLADRLVGITLIVMSLCIFISVVRNKHSHAAPTSRIAMLVTWTQWAAWRIRAWMGSDALPPVPFRFTYDRGSVFVVGIIHGLGAETPSQLALFMLTAQVGGAAMGVVGLLCFLAGLLAMNTFMTATASGLKTSSLRAPWMNRGFNLLVASYSLAAGVIFAAALADKLPPLGH